MNKKARSILGLLVLSGSLVSCSFDNETALYTIEFYTDYEGISSGEPGEAYSAGDLNASKDAINLEDHLVGRGYVAQDGTNRVARLTSLKLEEGKAVEYEKTNQNKKEGYAYTWDSWQGFYQDENGLYDQNKPVDLKNITGDCKVFAHFSAEINTYNVSIRNADFSTIFEGKAEHGMSFGDLLKGEYGTIEKAEEALKDVAYPLPAYYYQSHEFSGNYKDSGDNLYSVDALLEQIITEDWTLTAVFKDPINKSYKVSFYSDEAKTKLKEERTIGYGEAVPSDVVLDDETSEGMKRVFEGWKGKYGDEAPAEIRGRDVDPAHILYDCSLTPVFESSPVSYSVTFFNEDDTTTELMAAHGSLFGDLDAPKEIAGLGSDQIFTGLWSKAKGDVSKSEVIASSTPITGDLALYPVIVQKAFPDEANGKGDLFSYEYSLEWDGYLLTKFVPSSSRVDAKLEESDLPLSSLPDTFGLAGIESLSDGTSSYSSSLTEASFPSSVAYVASNAFRGNRSLQKLALPGLKKADPFAFSQLYSLPSFALPSSLESIGTKAFYMCSALNEIKIEMSEEEAKAKVSFSLDWNRVSSDKIVEPTYSS